MLSPAAAKTKPVSSALNRFVSPVPFELSLPARTFYVSGIKQVLDGKVITIRKARVIVKFRLLAQLVMSFWSAATCERREWRRGRRSPRTDCLARSRAADRRSRGGRGGRAMAASAESASRVSQTNRTPNIWLPTKRRFFEGAQKGFARLTRLAWAK